MCLGGEKRDSVYLLVCQRIKGPAENRFPMRREKILGLLGFKRRGGRGGRRTHRARNEGDVDGVLLPAGSRSPGAGSML